MARMPVRGAHVYSADSKNRQASRWSSKIRPNYLAEFRRSVLSDSLLLSVCSSLLSKPELRAPDRKLDDENCCFIANLFIIKMLPIFFNFDEFFGNCGKLRGASSQLARLKQSPKTLMVKTFHHSKFSSTYRADSLFGSAESNGRSNWEDGLALLNLLEFLFQTVSNELFFRFSNCPPYTSPAIRLIIRFHCFWHTMDARRSAVDGAALHVAAAERRNRYFPISNHLSWFFS